MTDDGALFPTGYNTHRPEDRAEMLQAIGLTRIEELFRDIPGELLLNRPLDLPAPLNEWQLEAHLRQLADRNATTRTHLCFLGGGAYEHYIPAVVDAIVSRGEFLTAYTPYQPEISQGLLQALFEYQLLVGRLLGLPMVNSSVYDGATALAESAWMISSITERRVLLASEAIWPQWREVLRTYMHGRRVTVLPVRCHPETGRLDREHLRDLLSSGEAAGLVLQTPNASGVIEDVAGAAELCHAHGALLAVSCNPVMAGLLKPPGQLGADVVTAEGQPLGIPLSGGGPYVGLMATREEYAGFLPGRIVGEVSDVRGAPAYSLVREEREQHVARDRATSAICSNQALLAIRVAIYLSLLGDRGLRELAGLNVEKARYLSERLCALEGVRLAKSGPFFNEFLLELPCSADVLAREMAARGVFGGLPSADVRGAQHLLVAVTEVKSRAQLDRMAAVFAEALAAVREPGGRRSR